MSGISTALRLALAAVWVVGAALAGPGQPHNGQQPALARPAAQAPGSETCQTLQPGPTAGQDAYIRQDKPDERRGDDSEMRVNTEGGKLNRALLRFDLPSLPPGVIVNSATLSLYVKDVKDNDVAISAHQVLAAWNEAEVTWNDRDQAAGLPWANPGGDYSDATLDIVALTEGDKDFWAAWDITDAAAGWISNPTANFGVLLESPVTDPKNETKFRSSDDGAADERPRLEICYSAGLTLEPDHSAEGVPGHSKTYPHVVRIGELVDVIELTAVSSQGWTVHIYEDEDGDGVLDPEDDPISQTPAIGPNQEHPILVQVDVPLGALVGAIDETLVTAVAQAAGLTETADDRTQVGRLLTVQPDNSLYAVAGAVVFYGHQVINNGDVEDCLTIGAVSSQGWTVLLWEDLNANGVHETENPNEPPLANPVCFGPGETYHLVAELHVPADAAEGLVDETVITATSGNQPGKSASATDMTEVFVNDPPLIDGRYDDIYRISADAEQICYSAGGVLFGSLATFYQPGGDAVYMVLAIDKDFVDNTYGVNAVNWPDGHDFSKLVGSDHAQFLGYDAAGGEVLDFRIDYISSSDGTPSGYASLGLEGDGKIDAGDPAHILEWGTSLPYSLNELGYCIGGDCAILGADLTEDSPPSDAFYTPNPTYPDWIFDVIYEVKIDVAAFGAAGFGWLEVPYIHASPSKIGENTIIAEPGVCPGQIGDFVWHDLDHDGVQDAGEPGIDDVDLSLYQDDGDGLFDPAADSFVGVQTTSAGGQYLFQDLPPGDYFVDVVDATVPPGFVITTFNDPTAIIALSEGESHLTADFGYVEPFAGLAIVKSLVGESPVYLEQEITFTVRITNTGATVIVHLPLQDFYDPAKLDYLGATPPSDDDVDDGVIDWSDLTASFGGDLLPGQAFELALRFRAAQATQDDLLAALPSQAAAPQVEPTVDGRLDDGYLFLAHFTRPPADAPGNLYGFEGAETCYWAFVVDRAFNDNVYADHDDPYLLQDGWDRSHKFNDLKGSDKAVFDVLYPGGDYSGLTLDYLNDNGDPWSSGQTGGDGSEHPGTPPIDQAMTSLHWNLENANWDGGAWGDPLEHSPPWDYNQSSGEYWEWHMIYEFSIPKSLMGGQCGQVTLADAHNSPHKDDEDLGKIGDRVWEDVDFDGLQDDAEVGLPGVTLHLHQDDAIVRTTQTEPGTSGYYIFNNLEAGVYVVDVDESTLPLDYALTSANEPMTVTISAGGVFLAADFGYYFQGAGSIGDRVFYDLDGDGLPDDDPEPGINYVAVNLHEGACPPAGDPLRTQITAGNGDYDFIHLPAGVYCVAVDDGALPASYALTTDNNPLTVTLADGQDYDDADFGYRAQCVGGTADVAIVSGAIDDVGIHLPDVQDDACVEIEPAPAAIGDFVWHDEDADGVQDAGEPGVAGVLVSLYDGAGGLVASMTTAADGGYLFEGLAPGSYVVEFAPPAGWAFSPPDQGADDAADSDADPATGQTAPIELESGESDLTWDAGLYRPAALGDFVWQDVDYDGVQDAGEPGVAGVLVSLYDGAGGLVASMTTAADGGYLFEGLTPGSYVVEFAPPAGWAFSPPDQGADDAADSDADPATGQTAPIELESGKSDLTWDAGLAGADLLVIKHDIGYDPVLPGVNVIYTIIVCNQGPGIVQDIEFSESFSADLTFISTTAPNCDVAPGAQGPAEFTCFYAGLLSSGQCLDYEFEFEATMEDGEQVENCVGVISPVTPEPVDEFPNSDCEITERRPPTAVPVSGLMAAQQGGAVTLTWEATGSDFAGFRLLRSALLDPAADPVELIGFMAPRPDGQYRFVDETVVGGATYAYWLLLIENSGQERQVASLEMWVQPWQTRRIFLPAVF